MNKVETFINSKMKLISLEKDILDVGGGKGFNKWLFKYKELFNDCNYKTFDYDDATGADIIGDIHNMPVKSESVDAIICSSVLEHVENPHIAVKEMFRILKNNGKIFVYVPSIYPYHARKNHYQDYWRFFDDSLRLLFKDFSYFEIVKRGGYFMAFSFFVPYQNKFRNILNVISYFFDKIFKTKNRTTTAGYYIYAIK